jgi:PadR family transcriptional regulator
MPSGAQAERPDKAGRSKSGDTTREVLLGFIRMHILHHAAEEPVYGLWLIEELQRHGYKMSAGTLYPILHSLESRALLTRSSRLFEGKIRKYYAITPKGRKALQQMRRKLKELTAEVLPES